MAAAGRDVPEDDREPQRETGLLHDDAFMQRRMDYSPDVTGNPPVAHYTHDPRTFDGFVFPTRRRVHLHDPGGVANQKFAPITLDIASVAVDRG